MGHNHHQLLNSLRHHIGKKVVMEAEFTMQPKGCIVVNVGGDGEEQQKFVVPVMYLNHPLFIGLLKEAEEEYGFHHKGAITIPCRVEYFYQVQDIINRDKNRCRGHSHRV